MSVATVTAVGPDLLELVAGRLAGAAPGLTPTLAGLRSAFRQVITDTGAAEGRIEALVEDLVRELGEHLLAVGQHPHPDLPRTVEDWLMGVSVAQLRDELELAAAWWRDILSTPGRGWSR